MNIRSHSSALTFSIKVLAIDCMVENECLLRSWGFATFKAASSALFASLSKLSLLLSLWPKNTLSDRCKDPSSSNSLRISKLDANPRLSFELPKNLCNPSFGLLTLSADMYFSGSDLKNFRALKGNDAMLLQRKTSILILETVPLGLSSSQ